MKKVVATLQSASPYSQSKHYNVPKLDKESAADYEKRTWKNRIHVDKSGNVFIPPMAFKNCMSDAAKYLSIGIKGKGKSTYTKHFVAGLLVMDPVSLGIKIDDIQGETLFVPSDGKRGGGSRVEKIFPVVPEWKANVTFYILDETITEAVFVEHLKQAGMFIGIGRFRPINNGFYGRFDVLDVKWDV